MGLHIKNLVKDKELRAFYPDLRKYFKKSFEVLGIDSDYDVSLIIVDPQKIQELNREFRSIDRPTDVITFAEIDGDGDDFEDELYLGDIFVNRAAVYDQAKEYGHSVKREFCFLFVHGLLHTLGYDHMEKDDEKVMFDLQKKILEDLR